MRRTPPSPERHPALTKPAHPPRNPSLEDSGTAKGPRVRRLAGGRIGSTLVVCALLGLALVGAGQTAVLLLARERVADLGANGAEQVTAGEPSREAEAATRSQANENGGSEWRIKPTAVAAVRSRVARYVLSHLGYGAAVSAGATVLSLGIVVAVWMSARRRLRRLIRAAWRAARGDHVV